MNKENRTKQQLLEELLTLRKSSASMEEQNNTLKQEILLLQKKEEQFRVLVETTSDFIWEIDEKGTYTYVSPQVKSMLGYEPEEMVGKTPFDFMSPDESERILLIFNDLVERKQPIVRLENTCLHKEGQPVIFETSGLPFLSKDETFSGYRGIDRDITEHKHAEEILKTESDKLRAIMEGIDLANIGIDIVSIDHTILFQNQVLLNNFESSPGSTCYERYMNREKPCDLCPMEKAVKNNQLERAELTTPDGKTYEILSAPLPDSKGKVDKAIEVVVDITGRKQTQEEFINNQARLELALEAARAGTWNWNVKTGEISLDERSQKLFGFEPGIFDRSFDAWKKIVHPDDLEKAQKLAGEGLETGIIDLEYRIKTKEGLKTISVYGQVIKDEENNPALGIGIHLDITEKKKLEKQLYQTGKIEAIGNLAGGIAHDFNNILAGIIGYTELAKRKLPPDTPVKKYLDGIYASGLRAKDLTTQILTFSRQSEQVRKPVQMNSIIIETLKLLRASIPTTIEIRLRFEEHSATVMADPTQLHQVLMNLCTNASHAMQEKGGILEIHLSSVLIHKKECVQYNDIQPGPYIKLKVTDTGSGIDPAIIDRIFEPFFTTREKGGGTGLGLAVIYGIIKTYGGDITVESPEGKGSVFSILLPKIKGEIKKEKKGLKPLLTGNESILLVDDEDVLLTVGQDLLETLGYTTVSMNSSRAALETFKEEPGRFDLVITDQTMPQITGYELAKQLMEVRADIPVILCTGYSKTINPDIAEAAGIKAFIMKPVNLEELSETIRKVLDQQKVSP